MTVECKANSAVDLTRVKPYGDALNDGKVQLSFTLPVPYGEEAEECAKPVSYTHLDVYKRQT